MLAYVRRLKNEVNALYYALRDPRTPVYARILMILIVTYAFSPIDLIPDFIPVLGYLDDLILLPLGIALVIRMIPEDVMIESRARAAAEPVQVSTWLGAVFVVGIWVLVVVAMIKVIG